jgi:hypothetical protein
VASNKRIVTYDVGAQSPRPQPLHGKTWNTNQSKAGQWSPRPTNHIIRFGKLFFNSPPLSHVVNDLSIHTLKITVQLIILIAYQLDPYIVQTKGYLSNTMAQPKSQLPLILGLAAAGGVGYYLYSAGGSPKAAEKKLEGTSELLATNRRLLLIIL